LGDSFATINVVFCWEVMMWGRKVVGSIIGGGGWGWRGSGRGIRRWWEGHLVRLWRVVVVDTRVTGVVGQEVRRGCGIVGKWILFWF
jgi:hypothetical protein